jgi:hypothetical protein
VGNPVVVGAVVEILEYFGNGVALLGQVDPGNANHVMFFVGRVAFFVQFGIFGEDEHDVLDGVVLVFRAGPVSVVEDGGVW